MYHKSNRLQLISKLLKCVLAIPTLQQNKFFRKVKPVLCNKIRCVFYNCNIKQARK